MNCTAAGPGKNSLKGRPARRLGIAVAAVVAGLMAVPAGLAAQDALPEMAPEMAVGTLAAPAADFYWPGADYDPAVPTMQSVLGYAAGQKVAGHQDVVRYFEALAAYAPDRVRLMDYGRSWQGRRLFYAVVGSPDQIARLDAIRADAQALADPRRTPQGGTEALLARHPAVVWLAGSVHGDEISPTESAMLTAYHLLAARGDARLPSIRQNALVIINPLQNPDGRERFIASSVGARGTEPDPDPLAAERDQQWPGGRANHFAFDLNRDWFALTQPETRAHTAALLQWFPQVMADVHEMGTEQTYFFPPEADPINPNVTQGQRELRQIIGRNTASWFDRFGIAYFTRETFDLFYPGYGDGWPTMHGTISMTYEQGSARGLLARRSSGEVLTFPETIRHQFVAALSTVEAAAANRERFVRGFHDFRRSAIAEGRQGPTRAWVIPAQADQATADKLAAVLVRQGAEVTRATASFTACGRSFAAGSYVISMAQPAGRLVRNLMEPTTQMDPAFVARQQERRARGLEDEIYDVTAWSLPLVYNVEAVACGTDPAVQGVAAGPELVRPGTVANPAATVAFVASGGSAATGRFTVAALRAGLVVRSMSEAFTLEGVSYPEGSVVAVVGENAAGLSARLQDLARRTGASLTGHSSSWVTAGPSLGSEWAVRLRLPRIAMAWDRPVGRNSAGNARYVLEQKLGFAVTPVRVDRMASADLAAFDVVLVADNEGSYTRGFGASGAANLRRFVERGGVLISFAGATRWLADPAVNLLSARPETAVAPEGTTPERPDSDASSADGTVVADEAAYARMIAAQGGAPTALDGALLRVATDPDSWLTTGLKPELIAMMDGSDIWRPLARDQGENPVRFVGPDRVVASGVVWEPTRVQIAFKPFVLLESQGAGLVVGFTGDPGYRAHTDGLDPLILNAILQTTARVRITR
jgi:hypothetical protein